MHTKVCPACGDVFEAANGHKKYCNKKHMTNCEICGDEFEILVLNKPAKVCSQRCVGKLSVLKKAETTKDTVKVCAFQTCGDEFTPKSSRQKYCTKQHTMPCEVCETSFPVKQNHRPGRVCSHTCAGKLNTIEAGKRGLEKHIEKLCKLCGDSFMTNRDSQVYCKMPHPANCFSCNKEFKIERAYEGRLKYTCGDMKCRQNLIESTNQERYGVNNPFQSEEVKKNIRESNLISFGFEYPSQSKEIMDKVHKTMIEKYGAKTPMQVSKFKKAIIDTNVRRYGAENLGLFNVNNIDDYSNFEDYVLSSNKSIKDLTEYFNVKEKTIRSKIIKSDNEHLFPSFYTMSKKEREIVDLLEYETDLYISIHNRSVIKPQEIDIYLPEIEIGIEISPTYTHNSKQGWGGLGEGLKESYHYDKFKLAEFNNIELITLFDWYDYKKMSKYIKSLIITNMNISKLRLQEVLYEEISKEYISWNLELNPDIPDVDSVLSVYNGKKLVAVLIVNIDGCNIEVLDFVQSPEFPRDNLLIATFNLLKDKYKSIEVIVNYDLSSGSIFKKIGFETLREIKPAAIYSNEKRNVYVKEKDFSNNIGNLSLADGSIIKGGDVTIEKLEENGFLPVYDCGKAILIWRYST